MVDGGVDIVVAHMGLTVGGAIGATHAINMEVAAQGVSAIAEASRRARKDVFVVAHGGPIASPEDAANCIQDMRGRWLRRRLQHGAAAD